MIQPAVARRPGTGYPCTFQLLTEGNVAPHLMAVASKMWVRALRARETPCCCYQHRNMGSKHVGLIDKHTARRQASDANHANHTSKRGACSARSTLVAEDIDCSWIADVFCPMCLRSSRATFTQVTVIPRHRAAELDGNDRRRAGLTGIAHGIT